MIKSVVLFRDLQRYDFLFPYQEIRIGVNNFNRKWRISIIETPA
jgi:hypothetical protein